MKPRLLKAVRLTCAELPNGIWFGSSSILLRAYEKPRGQNLTQNSIPTLLKLLVKEGLIERRPVKEQLCADGRIRFHWEYRRMEDE